MRKKSFILVPCFGLSFFLLFLFFLQFNNFVFKSHQIKNYERKIASLLKENEELEMIFFEKNHLEKIDQIAKNLNFEKTGKVEYIKVLEKTVVSK